MTPRIPKISIVISVYNKASFLNECIESVINQDLTDFEVICIDAGSTDRSLTILQEYASKDYRIAVYNTPYTEIPSVTKNYGIDRSKGEYVFNLDADDYLSPNTLQKMYSKAIQTNADAVIPDLQIVKDKSKNIQSRKIGLNYDRNAILTGNEAVTESLDWTIHAFALWKGDLIRRLRLEEFGTYSDEYSARLLFFNCNKITFSEGSYNYRIHTESLTGAISSKTYDRPYAIYRLALFLEQNHFEEANICSSYFSAFKDCCFLNHNINKLKINERKTAEKKIENVYNLIDKRRVRRSLFTTKAGRTEIWQIKGKINRAFFAFLTFLDWKLIGKITTRTFKANFDFF